MPTLVSDYSEHLKGVDAVVHVAAQLMFNKGASSDEIFHVGLSFRSLVLLLIQSNTGRI